MDGSIPPDAGMGGTWLAVYFSYAAAALAVVLSCLLVRTAFGASPVYLARTRCYELPPVRLVFHAVHLGVWLAFVTALWIVARHGWAYYQTSADHHGLTALAATGTGVLTGALGWATFVGLIRVSDNRPPTVAVSGVETSEGIDPHRLANLGREQFPQMVAYGHTAGLWGRGVLLAAGFGCAAFVIAASTAWGRENGLHGTGLTAVQQVRTVLPAAPRHWAIVVGLSAALGLGLLLFSNATYTLLRFPTTLFVAAGLSALGWSCAALLDSPDEQLGVIVGGLGLAFAVRWTADLRRALQFTRARNVSQPIAGRLSREIPYLATLTSRRDCSLATLDEDELRDRISDGCRNVEEASLLVTRNLARFLSLEALTE